MSKNVLPPPKIYAQRVIEVKYIRFYVNYLQWTKVKAGIRKKPNDNEGTIRKPRVVSKQIVLDPWETRVSMVSDRRNPNNIHESLN